MFTLQARLLENAGGSQMAQSLGNCSAELSHRGRQANRYVGDGLPNDGVPPGGGAPWGGVTEVRNITINIPPWQNIPFVPMPFIDMASGFPNEFKPPYHAGEPDPFPANDWAYSVAGDSNLGDTQITNLYVNNQHFYGDVYYRGRRIAKSQQRLVTDVRWQDNKLLVTTRPFILFGSPIGAGAAEIVIAGESCPDEPVEGAQAEGIAGIL